MRLLAADNLGSYPVSGTCLYEACGAGCWVSPNNPQKECTAVSRSQPADWLHDELELRRDMPMLNIGRSWAKIGKDEEKHDIYIYGM